MNALKPCPFCGSKAIYTSVEGYPSTYKGREYPTAWCKCVKCNVTYTVDKWNTRNVEGKWKNMVCCHM